MNQLVFPLDLEVTLYEKDITFTIHHLIECIPHEAFASFLRRIGCPAYRPRMMLKFILCGYTQSAFLVRLECIIKQVQIHQGATTRRILRLLGIMFYRVLY